MLRIYMIAGGPIDVRGEIKLMKRGLRENGFYLDQYIELSDPVKIHDAGPVVYSIESNQSVMARGERLIRILICYSKIAERIAIFWTKCPAIVPDFQGASLKVTGVVGDSAFWIVRYESDVGYAIINGIKLPWRAALENK